MTLEATTYRRFTRDADRAVLGGVCAGIARYFGFNLFVTRVLCCIAFCAAFPFALVAYIAVVLLVPAESRGDEYIVERVIRRRRRPSRRQRRTAAEAAQREEAESLSERARELEERLARIEKRVTSRRYRLDEEFRNL